MYPAVSHGAIGRGEKDLKLYNNFNTGRSSHRVIAVVRLRRLLDNYDEG